MDVLEYYEEMNDIADMYEDEGDKDSLNRLRFTAMAVAVQLGIAVGFSSEIDDHVPP